MKPGAIEIAKELDDDCYRQIDEGTDDETTMYTTPLETTAVYQVTLVVEAQVQMAILKVIFAVTAEDNVDGTSMFEEYVILLSCKIIL